MKLGFFVRKWREHESAGVGIDLSHTVNPDSGPQSGEVVANAHYKGLVRPQAWKRWKSEGCIIPAELPTSGQAESQYTLLISQYSIYFHGNDNMIDSNPLYQHTISIHPNMLSRFSRLFQQGVLVQATVGCSVHAFLCHQIGIRPDYLENRIQTIFLNGKAIDAPDQSVIANGSTLALSAAMPGLVGATFRKGGKYATLRAGITDTSSKIGMHEETGCVTVRLFNFMAAEIGPLFLKRGIIVTGRDILDAIGHLESTANAFQIDAQPSSKRPVGTLNPHDNILLILSPE